MPLSLGRQVQAENSEPYKFVGSAKINDCNDKACGHNHLAQGSRPNAARQRSIQVVAEQLCEYHPNRNLMGAILVSGLSSS